MESSSYLNKSEEYKNNQIKECPYCNSILPLSEYNDHMFCHQIDEQENGQQNFNINNFGTQMSNNNNINSYNNNNINSCNNNNNISSFNNNNNIQQNCNNPPSKTLLNNNNNINNINSININNNSNNQNKNIINEDNNFSLFNDDNDNTNINNIQPNIDPKIQNLNSINCINDNNNNNNINNNNNNINNNNNNININNNINNVNNQNNIINNNNNNNVNNQNQNNNNNINQNKDDSSQQGQTSFLDTIKSYYNNWIPSYFSGNKNNDKEKEKENNLLNAPIESLSPEEREKRYKIEEQKAYEKKILGIANSESKVKPENNSNYGEKISNYIQNNTNTIFAVIDIIGCLTLHTPSIGRTITRVANFIGDTMNNSNNNNQNNQNNNINPNELGELNDYNSIIRNHPELKDKDKDPDIIIKFLPISEIKEIKNNNPNENNNNNNNRCIICLSEFEIGDQVSALPCAHVFHTNCIASWLKKHCQCPVCKFEITLRSLIG